jgi:hypothetical protein
MKLKLSEWIAWRIATVRGLTDYTDDTQYGFDKEVTEELNGAGLNIDIELDENGRVKSYGPRLDLDFTNLFNKKQTYRYVENCHRAGMLCSVAGVGDGETFICTNRKELDGKDASNPLADHIKGRDY